jgi:putative FmdB family regulatory protein
MPRYDYRCGECGLEFEQEQGINDPPLKNHKGPHGKCGPVKRLISSTHFHLKGEGWAKDGYGPNTGKGKKE